MHMTANIRPSTASGLYFRNTARNSKPPNSSTRMYRGEIGALHAAHLPRSASHERIGMFCHHLIGELHFGQCDGGETIDSPRGARQMTTLRNEAMHAPNQNEKKPSMAISAGSFLISPRAPSP